MSIFSSILKSVPIVNQVYSMYDTYHQDKQNRKAQRQQNNLSGFAENLARMQWEDLDPLRTSVIDRSTDFMEGGLDPTASAMYGPMKTATEQQYGTAKNAIMSSMPRGGTLADSLAKLEAAKAGTMSELVGKLVEKEYDNAFNLGGSAGQSATNAVSTAMGSGPGVAALSQSGSMLNSRVGANMEDLMSYLKYLKWI